MDFIKVVATKVFENILYFLYFSFQDTLYSVGAKVSLDSFRRIYLRFPDVFYKAISVFYSWYGR